MAAGAIRGKYSPTVAGEEADGSSDDDSLSGASSDSGPASLSASATVRVASQSRLQAKHYKRQSAASSAASTTAPALSQQQKSSSTKRRILRKDRRTTLDMLTSDDDVNEYEETRPSSYLEPAARRNLHEEKPQMRSSFETLYNPELNQPLKDPEQLSISLSSSCDSLDAADGAAVGKSSETWHLVSGPMVSPKAKSAYLDVTQSFQHQGGGQELSGLKQEPARAPAHHDDLLDKEENIGKALSTSIQQDICGEIWTEFGAPEMHEPAKAKQLSTFGQPLNVRVQLSRPNEKDSHSAKTNTAIGVDVKIELGTAVKSSLRETQQDTPVEATVPAKDPESATKAIESGEQQPRWAKLPAWMLLLPDKASPKRSNHAIETSSERAQPVGVSQMDVGVAEKPRGKRILPAVPDSADLEVTDLLRENQETVAADRPKSAVDILVSKSRSGSVLQTPSQPDGNPTTVSQQLRSLFHNPSPLIMLHRAATKPTLLPPPLPQSDNLEYLSQQQTNRYTPLRGTQHRIDDVRRSGNGSASSILLPNHRVPHRPLQGSLRSEREPVQPPELPFRRNRSLLHNSRLQPETLAPPQYATHAAAQVAPPLHATYAVTQVAPQPHATYAAAQVAPPPHATYAAAQVAPPPHATHAAAHVAPPPPPPVPPRQAKSVIARQQPPSTFFPNKQQLLHNSSTGPRTVARSRREVVQDFGQDRDTKGRELHSVEQLYKRVLVSPAQSAKHSVILKSPELNGDDSDEYLLARNPSPDEERHSTTLTTSLVPTRIQTNPHLVSRARDSINRREESDDRKDTSTGITKLNSTVLDLALDLASLVSKEDEEEGSMTHSKAIVQGPDLTETQPIVVSTRRVMDSVQRLNQLAQPTSQALGSQTVHQFSAHDRLFGKSASSTVRTNVVTNSQTVEKDSPPKNVSSSTRLQSNMSPKFALRNGKEVRMPANAVRVLPREDDSELQRRMRALGSRSAGRSPRAPTDDAVAGLEKMCREMRLEDEGLLDGAERHDTPIRVQARMDALTAREVVSGIAGNTDTNGIMTTLTDQSAAERPYYVQHRGIFPFNRETDDQAKRFHADSNRKNSTVAKSQPQMLAKTAGASVSQRMPVSPQAASSTVHNQNRLGQIQLSQSESPQLLQPGEREEGPEIFL